jgi:DNA mismatch endonuclease, patch repair protein
MVDIVDKTIRSKMMSRIRGKNTDPEMIVRRGLSRKGVRYRLHDRDLPGKPDLKMKGRRAVIFVHGCYWHQHGGCHWGTHPSSRVEFWGPKLAGNVCRDARNRDLLIREGWRVGVVWECSLRPTWREKTIDDVFDWLNSDEALFETPIVRPREAYRSWETAGGKIRK